MHELGVTKALFDTIMKAAEKNHAEKINDIYLVLGKKSGIEAECVEYYFSLLSEGTVAEKARLHFSPEEESAFYIDRMEIEEEDPEPAAKTND